MSIQSLGSSSQYEYQPVTSSSSVSSLSSLTAGVGTNSAADGSTSGGSTQLSGFAQFLSKLQSLQQSNPAQAQQVLTDVAAKLTSDAQSTSGPQATQLNALAQKFQQAASTGDLTSLQPQATSGHHGGHHHHHGGGGGGGTSSQGQAAYAQGSASSLLDQLNTIFSADTGSTSATSSTAATA